MSDQPVDQIAVIIHKSFKVAQGGLRDITGIIGASQPSSDLRRDIFENLSALQTGTVRQEDLDAFHASVQVAQSVGILDEQAVQKIYNLLEEI